jgi:SAM-dependent methyltransferase
MIHQLRVALSRAGLRPGEYSGDYEALKKLYRSRDPWRLQSAKESRRFELTCELVRCLVPSCPDLLEIGSGEGLQTEHFARIARRVTGIELSAVAVERARQRVPQAQFHEGCAEDLKTIVGGRAFDLATACEVLYYSPNAARILRDLREVAPRVLITNHCKQARRLASLFEGPGWRRLADIRVEGTVWRCDLWECASVAPDARSVLA